MRTPAWVILLGAAVLIVFLAWIGRGSRDNFADIGSVSSQAAAVDPSSVAPLDKGSPVNAGTPALHAPSSALIKQLLATPAVEPPASSTPTANSVASQATANAPISVNPLQRAADAKASIPHVESPTPSGPGLPPMPPRPDPTCPSCPICPDMSQYIKLDEIPCWNCSLP